MQRLRITRRCGIARGEERRKAGAGVGRDFSAGGGERGDEWRAGVERGAGGFEFRAAEAGGKAEVVIERSREFWLGGAELLGAGKDQVHRGCGSEALSGSSGNRNGSGCAHRG
jgi:hypothetical protein